MSEISWFDAFLADIRAFIEDMDRLNPEPGSPAAKLLREMKAAVEEYEKSQEAPDDRTC